MNIADLYPVGAKIRLFDDYPDTYHEVYGYECFKDQTNIVFVDGLKLSTIRLELIAQVEYPSQRYEVVIPKTEKHAELFWKFQKSDYESVKLEYDCQEEAIKCQQAICMLLSRNRIYNIRATRRKNVLKLIRE